jgi:hypothetical protein
MPPQILVLEPDPARQVAFRAALASAGRVSRAVATEAEAAALLGRETFGLVLLGPDLHNCALQAAQATPVIRLALLPDCVVGEVAPGSLGDPPRDLPAILEALTRYMRFAPPRPDGGHEAPATLLEEWTEFEGRPP